MWVNLCPHTQTRTQNCKMIDKLRTRDIQLFLGTFLPLDKGRNTAILGPTDYFSDARTYWVVREEKKSQRNTTQKTPNNSKKSSPVGSNSRNEVCVIITDFTCGTEEVRGEYGSGAASAQLPGGAKGSNWCLSSKNATSLRLMQWVGCTTPESEAKGSKLLLRTPGQGSQGVRR